MSSCEDDLEAGMRWAHEAASRIQVLEPNDELIQPLTKQGVDQIIWDRFRERFRDRSGTWDGQPICINAAFWKNYAQALEARANELEAAAKAST